MMDVVIIAKNEGIYVEKIINSIDKDWHIVYVADRCTDNTIEQLDALRETRENLTIIDTTKMDLTGRQTSTCRNLGLKYTNAGSDVLFLDGDRYAVGGSYKDAVDGAKAEIVCFPLQVDSRTPQSFSDTYGCVNSGFFSCGIFFRRFAIEKVIKWQGSLFNNELQYEWGIEDTSLGDLCYHLGLNAELTDKCVLQGEFTYATISKTARLKRFIFREPLNVKWLNN
ncbi:MAG: glycosyltransferase family 2 protein [Paludibacteraceae bacterium]|nr:glycosyltransferase family 2 protein [Paludibacteraceae bacterium]